MKNLALFALLGFTVIIGNAQTKVWELTTPDNRHKYGGEFVPDLNNPQKFYLSGNYTARAFTLNGKMGDWIDMGGQTDFAYILSNDTRIYSLIHTLLEYNYNNFYTSSLLYSSTVGTAKGLRKSMFKAERYLDLASIRMIEGKLYVAMGGGDPFNKRPADSFVFVINEDAKTISTTKVSFPTMKMDEVVKARQDKGKMIHPGDWVEVSYDANSNESVIFRVSSVEQQMEASIFSLNLKTGAVSNDMTLETPTVNGYIKSSKVNTILRDGKNEIIVQVLLTISRESNVVNPAILILRYGMDGTLLGSKLHNFVDFTDYTQKTIMVRKFDMLAEAYYDYFAREYVLIGRSGESRNFQTISLDGDLSIKNKYPTHGEIKGNEKKQPESLPEYWEDYYGKPNAKIYFGENFVLVSHYDVTAEKSTIVCYMDK